jgi:hypothetical protein
MERESPRDFTGDDPESPVIYHFECDWRVVADLKITEAIAGGCSVANWYQDETVASGSTSGTAAMVLLIDVGVGSYTLSGGLGPDHISWLNLPTCRAIKRCTGPDYAEEDVWAIFPKLLGPEGWRDLPDDVSTITGQKDWDFPDHQHRTDSWNLSRGACDTAGLSGAAHAAPAARQAAACRPVKITKLKLNDIDDSKLRYLSAAAHTYLDGNTRVHGTITVKGDPDDELESLVLEVVQGGQTVATARLAPDASGPLLHTPFGADKKVEIKKSQRLFDLPSAEAAKVNGSADGILTLRAKAVSKQGSTATEDFGSVKILVRYEGSNRYGERDDPKCISKKGRPLEKLCGGDDWVLPSIKKILDHYAGVTVDSKGLVIGDISNMNGGPFPEHRAHKEGLEIDGKFTPNEFSPTAAHAKRLIGFLNDATYGKNITTVWVTYEREDGDPVWDEIKDVTLNDRRAARDVIRVAKGHDTHFHWVMRP